MPGLNRADRSSDNSQIVRLLTKVLDYLRSIRGSGYTRIAQRVILVGASAMAISLLDFLRTILQLFGRDTPPLYDPWVGVWIIFSALAFHLVSQWIDPALKPVAFAGNIGNTKYDTHNIEVIKRINRLIPYSYFQDNILNLSNGMSWDFLQRLIELEDYRAPRFRIFDPDIESLKEALLKECFDLTIYGQKCLFSNPTGTRVTLPPEWIKGGGADMYREYESELKRRGVLIFKKYDDFYQAVVNKGFLLLEEGTLES